MSDETTPDLTALLAEHEYHVAIDGTIRPACKCGWITEGDWDSTEVYDAHLAEQIAAAGFGPVRAVEAEIEAMATGWLNAATRAESAEAALAGLTEGLTEAIEELIECRSFIAVETRHYPTVTAINEKVEALRALLAPTPDREEES